MYVLISFYLWLVIRYNIIYLSSLYVNELTHLKIVRVAKTPTVVFRFQRCYNCMQGDSAGFFSSQDLLMQQQLTAKGNLNLKGLFMS